MYAFFGLLGGGDAVQDGSGVEMILPDQVSLKRKDGFMVPVTLTGGFVFHEGNQPPSSLILRDCRSSGLEHFYNLTKYERPMESKK
mgnify:CR=1 FL=1